MTHARRFVSCVLFVDVFVFFLGLWRFNEDVATYHTKADHSTGLFLFLLVYWLVHVLALWLVATGKVGKR